MVSDLTIIRLNPTGLETRARVGMQKKLYRSDTKLGKQNFAFAGIYPKLNPASVHLGIGGEVQPVAALNVKAFVELQQYFGTFGFLQGFTSPAQTYSDDRLKKLADQPDREPQATNVLHVGLAPLLQAKVGPVAVRLLMQLDYWQLALEDGETAAYEPTFDTLLPDGGFTFSTDTDLLYTGKPGLAVGLRHTWVHPLYRASHFADDDLSTSENLDVFNRFGSANSHQRLGILAAYTLHDRGPSAFNKPTVLAIASIYLDHRYRTGAPTTLRPGDTSADYRGRAFPYLVLGFAFESDLLAAR